MNIFVPLMVAAAMTAALTPAGVSASEPSCTGSLRIGSKLLKPGDDVTRAEDLLGTPARVVALRNRFGGIQAYQWVWRQDGYNARTIRATVKRGTVVEICRIKP